MVLIPIVCLFAFAWCSSGKSVNERAPKCCIIGDQSVAGVELEKVCAQGGKTVFHFDMTLPLEACVDLAQTELKDNNGRVYRGLSHEGLPDCTEQLKLRQPQPFTWTFEEVDDDATSVSLTENYRIELPEWKMGWNSWKWPRVDLSQCGF